MPLTDYNPNNKSSQHIINTSKENPILSSKKIMAKMKSLSKNKAQNVLTINTSLINKEEVFRMLALAQATGLPLLLVGAPGTGKTKTVIDYAKAFLMQGVDEKDAEAVKSAKQGFMDKIYILETDEGTKSSEVKGIN